MNYKDFSAKIKAKYPAYASLDDRDLAEKMIAKYPTYKSQVEFDDGLVDKAKGAVGVVVGGARKAVGSLIDRISDTSFMQEAAAGYNAMEQETGVDPLAKVNKAAAVPKNFYAGLTNVGKENIPYAGAAFEFAELTKLKTISDKVKDGSATEEETRWASEYIANLQEEKRRSEEEFGYQAGSIIRQSVQFMAELGGAAFLAPATGGTSLATFGATRVGLKGAKEVAEKLITDKATRALFTKEMGKYAAKAGVTVGVAGAPHVPAATLERMIGSPIVSEQGDFLGLAEDGLELPEALLYATTEQLVEIGSEYTGGMFTVLGTGVKAGLVKAGILKAITKENPNLTPAALQEILKRVGWHGVLQEFGEERVADVMYGVLNEFGLSDQDFKVPSLKQVAEELMAFGFMGTAIRAAENALASPIVQKDAQKAPGAAETPDEVDEVKTEIRERLEAGEAPQAVVLDLSQDMSTPSAEAIVKEAILDAIEETKAPEAKPKVALKEAQDTLGEISDTVDETVLAKSAKDIQAEFNAAQEKNAAEIATINKNIEDLKAKVAQAPDRSAAKKEAKKELEAARTKLRTAEKAFMEKLGANAQSFREFAMAKGREYGVKDLEAFVDAVVGQVSEGSELTVEQIFEAARASAAPAPVKKGKKAATKYTEGQTVTFGGKEYTITGVLKKEGENKYQLTPSEGAVFWTSEKGLDMKGELPGKQEKKTKKSAKETQKEKVKEVVGKKGKASIKEIARETGILEPNVRRILGVGAKEGEFERVADGVYRITANGQEVAVVIPADARESLPKLAAEGFKADMVFLDIPYDTPAVKGGNRGVNYNLISVDDFSKVLDSVKTILRDEDATVVHMYSQAPSGMAAMQKYNDLFPKKGFLPLAKGEYQKTFADGSPVTSPNGKVAKPEGIIIFNQSGNAEVLKSTNLQFKMVRPKGYQTEKPAEMLRALIEMTTDEGDVVLDPFAGSGVTAAEAVKAKRKAVAIEKDAEVAKKITKPRIEQAAGEKEETAADKYLATATPLYHGTDEYAKILIEARGFTLGGESSRRMGAPSGVNRIGEGVYFADTKEDAKAYAPSWDENDVITAYLRPGVKVKTFPTFNDYYEYVKDKVNPMNAKEVNELFIGEGFGGVKAGGDTVVFNPKNVLTERELRDALSNPQTPEEAAEIYWNNVIAPQIDANQTAVIGADDFKDYFNNDYDDKRHPIYSRAAFLTYERALKEAPAGEVALTGGGAGSGKTEILVKQVTGEVGLGVPAVLYDSNMANYDGVVKQIELARAEGRGVRILGLIPNLDMARKFTFMRQEKIGRGITAKTFARGHAGFPRVAKQLLDNKVVTQEEMSIVDVRDFRDIEIVKQEVREGAFVDNPLALLDEVQYNEDELRERYETQEKEKSITDGETPTGAPGGAANQASSGDRADTQEITNDQGTDSGGSGTDGGELPPPIQDGAEKPPVGGGAAQVTRQGKRRKEQPARDGGEPGERPGARLDNAAIETIVSSVTSISPEGEVILTGEVTDAVREAANQYIPGGKSKEGRGVLDEYYTSTRIVDMVKSLIDFPAQSIKVLEPAVGTGNFLYALPEIGKHTVVSHEINEVTARIAKIFHNSARVLTTPFESTFIDERGNKKEFERDYDLVIGNPPYGEHRGKYLGLGEAKDIKDYETYFIARGLSVLKTGGKLVMVVPSSFIRSSESNSKIGIIGRGKLVTAFRLPNGVFEGTDIGTDIVVFEKVAAGWAGSILPIVDDGFFKEHPENVLGTTKRRKNRFGKLEDYVEGTLDDALAAFSTQNTEGKAISLLNEMGVEATTENVETAEAAVEEAGSKAKALVKEAGKKTIEKKIVRKAAKVDGTMSLETQFEGEFSEEELALWRQVSPFGYIPNPSAEDKKRLNHMAGAWYLDFNYLQGDIYEKLEILEADKERGAITDAQYKEQKRKLEAVKPRQESIDDLRLSPNIGFVKDTTVGVDGTTNEPLTLKSAFLRWIGELPREAFGNSSNREVRDYVNDEQVRGNDKDMNERVRVRRKQVADNLFSKFLKEGLDADQKALVEDAYNKTFNFYHTPDYTKVPMFSTVHTTFRKEPFELRPVQKHGIGRLVNTGVGILAHDVGFGKTISGVVALHETMSRGWAKRPVVVVPSENVYRQWVSTIEELVPNAKLNLLGNLGASYKGDLSSLTIPNGSISIMTYEGFKRLGFKDETYDVLSAKFGYITDDLNKHKTERDREKAKAAAEAQGGRMKRGTRADLSFEDLGFDHITFDEVHNANHIVSKVKLEKGQASEFNRFGLQPSDLGIKTWLAAQYIQKQNGGRNVNLLSATPFTNHPLEYYSILSLVADKSMQKMGFWNVNDFFGTFMEAENEYEFKADGSYQRKTDIRRFRNYRQFRKLLDTYIDFKDGEVEGIVRPNRIQQTYEIPQNQMGLDLETKAQEIFQEDEKESGKGAKVLRAISELRKIAFSPYASKFSADISPSQYKEFVENSPKIATLMSLIAQNKKDREDAGQIVYVDAVGVEFLPLMRDYLVKELKYKPTEVEIISGATPKAKRSDIQDRYNKGEVKILLGSEAIKEGMNLQENTSDLYILSLPWNFTQLRQVIGRAWRQGNKWQNVRINNLFIQDSIDIFLSQKLENKQKRYEAAIKSGDAEVDVGDVSFDELKFDLIRNPETRAKLEVQAQKERLSQEIIQEKAELAFATRKLEKINTLAEEIRTLELDLANERKRRDEATAKGEEFSDFWITRYTDQLARAKKAQREELEKLNERGIDTKTLLEKRSQGEAKITQLEEQAKALTENMEDRVKEIAASLPVRVPFSPAVVDGFTADRATQNKTFYKLRTEPTEETVKPVKVKKEIKNAAGTKVVKTKEGTKVTRQKSVKQGVSKDTATFAILTDASLSVTEKVDKILEVKQKGKAFKDVGERVAGSKKERAAIRAVMESGSGDVFSEMVNRLGIDAVLEVLDKNEILDGVEVPNPEKDKADGVPALVALAKKELYDRIQRRFSFKQGRGRYSRDFVAWRRTSERSASSISERDKEYAIEVIKEYPALLREFVAKLTAVKTAEELYQFRRWFTSEFRERVVGRLYDEDIYVNTQVFGDAVDKYQPLAPHVATYGGQSTVFVRKSSFSYFAMTLTPEEQALFDKELNDQKWWDKFVKKSGKKEETDLRHGNFKPLERVERSGAEIPEDKVKPETLQEYGFKSVQFGNYMDDATSHEHIKHTLGSIDDLEELLNLDVKGIINKSGLSIAYGARGGSGFAVAHYEPAKNIINITKGRGDGSFFHEFVHYMDMKLGGRYRGKWSSKKERWYIGDTLDEAALRLMQGLTGRRGRKVKEFVPSDDPRIRESSPVLTWYKEGMPFEQAVEKAKEGVYEYRGRHKVYTFTEGELLQNVADTYRKSVSAEVDFYHEESVYARGSRTYGGDYWARPEEMLARAAQAYIEDKMLERGMKNNYLTRSTIAENETDAMAKVYPQGEERKQFNALFDKLFAELRRTYPRTQVKLKSSGQKTTYTRSDAERYLNDLKERLNIDFDVHFVDTILAGRRNPFTRREAYGATADNTMAIVKDMAAYTAEHESVHITLANLDKIAAFRNQGVTRDAVLRAKADQMGIAYAKKNEVLIEEQLAKDFEAYVSNNHEPKGIVRKFFALLRQALIRFARAIGATNGTVIDNYYEILAEGRAVDGEMVRLENQGIMESFIEDGVLDVEEIEDAMTRFKLKEEGDAHLRKLQGRYNDLVSRQEALEEDSKAWRTDLEAELIRKAETAKEVEAIPGMVKEAARFTNRKKDPVGELTERGLEVVETLGFENAQAAQEEVSEYLKRKTQLIETRNHLRALRRQIADAKRSGKVTRQALRDVERKLKLRKRLLEQKDFYMQMGFGRGQRAQMKMIRMRGRALRNAQDFFMISDKRAKDIINNRRIHLMSEEEFNNFLLEFSNKARELRETLDARDEVRSLIQEQDLQKTDNLRLAMGLPPVDKMTDEQARRFVTALSEYQFGDVFLTRRELETVHRTNWGEIKTERELFERMKDHIGVGREEMQTLTSPENGGYYTPWIKLARSHPFFNWLVGKRVEAAVVAERDYLKVEETINRLTRTARASRQKLLGLKGKVVETLVPTDDLVFGYLEAKNKEGYATKNGMTPEELAFADYLINLYHNAYEYMTSEYGMKGRENYMTHVRRSFFETLKESGIKSAFREILTSQKEDEAAFKILDEETGEVLAFEKFFGYAMRRSGALVPSKNVARASLAYFKAFSTKRALDAFIPEAMIAVQAHRAVTGTTEKGLTKDPTFEKFVKRFLNDAKGRRVWFGTRQGSNLDIGIRAYTTWIAIKYLGLNAATATANFIGDFTAIFWELSLKEAAKGITRTVAHPIRSYELNKEFRYFTGRNPLVELFDPKYNVPSRILKSLMVLMSLASFQSNKFFLRAKLTDREFEEGVLNDERLKEIALSLSRAKQNQFYVKSLAGGTTVGSSLTQFGTWAFPIFNAFTSDVGAVVKLLKEKKRWEALTSEETQKVLKLVIMGGMAVFVASLVDAPDDDDDSYLANVIRKAQREMTTLFQALQFVTDPRSYGMAVRELGSYAQMFQELLSDERYVSDGEGYGIGDPKWTRTLERIITPSTLKHFFPTERENTKERLIDEAIKEGSLNAEEVASFVAGDKWAEYDADQRKEKVGEVTRLYNLRRAYPDSRMGEIILDERTNDERIAAMVLYAQEVGVDRAYQELKTLKNDEALCVDPKKRNGCLVSGQLWKEFQKAKRLLDNQ